MRIRTAAVAGYFYPGDPEELRGMLAELIPRKEGKRRAKGLVCPHAGYIYSGSAAAQVYGSAELGRRFIIMGPNHTGMGAPLSIFARGQWRTPLGETLIDEELANRLLELCPVLEDDTHAHVREHSIEVQIPFLQYLQEDFSFVPICVGTSRWGDLAVLGEAIAAAIEETDEPIQIIASTDMSHYIPAREAREKDQLAFEAIRKLDGRALYDTVHQNRLSMCGYLPTTILLLAARRLGAQQADLVAYTHSGEVTGDHHSVVSYAGFIVV